MKRRGKAAMCLGLFGTVVSAAFLTGCSKQEESGKIKIEVVQYKQEAVKVFEKLEKSLMKHMMTLNWLLILPMTP